METNEKTINSMRIAQIFFYKTDTPKEFIQFLLVIAQILRMKSQCIILLRCNVMEIIFWTESLTTKIFIIMKTRLCTKPIIFCWCVRLCTEHVDRNELCTLSFHGGIIYGMYKCCALCSSVVCVVHSLKHTYTISCIEIYNCMYAYVHS